MYFTQEDYRKIENWLYKRSIKDNDLPIANSIKGNEKIPLLQDEENKISNIEDIAQYVGTTIIPDFYNITENNDDTSFKSLREALSKVPRSHQKLGLVITYRNVDDKWCIFQFTSKSLSAWYNAAYWEDILQRGKPNGTASLDETGKIPMSQLPDNIGGGNNLELGETSTTAYPGDKGKKNANAIRSLTNALDSVDTYSRDTRNQLDTFKNTKGKSQGIAPLDENGKVASSYLPSYVDDVLEYNTRTTFPTTGESGKIYIALDTNKTYRWGGTTYVELKSNIALGETSSTAYAGDKGKKNREDIENLQSNQSKFNTSLADVRSSFNNYASAKTPIIDKVEPHIANKQNPHEVTKAQVGLSNVTNDPQVKRSEMGTNNGVATLDDNGKIPESQLPAGVTSSLVLGETEGTAYEGSKGAKHEHTFNQFNTFKLITNFTTSSGNSGFTVKKINLSYDKDTGNITQMSGISAFRIPVADPTRTFDCGLLLNTDKKKLDGLFSIAGGLQDIDVANPTNNGITLGLDYCTFNKNTGETSTNTRNIYIPVADATKANGSGLMLNSDKTKLDSLSNYTLPTADSSTLGGIKIGSGLNIDSNGTVSVDNKLYILVNSLESVSTPDANKIYLVLNSSSTSETNSFTEYVWITSDTGGKWEKLGEASATVDLADYYNKTEINNKLSSINESITYINSINSQQQTAINNKVDKVEGKGLSTHDFNDSYKSYLDVLGNRSFGNSISSTIKNNEYKIHLRGMTGIANDIKTLSSITLPLASQSNCGLMSKMDKFRVDNALTSVPNAEPQVIGGVSAKIGSLDDMVNLNGPQPTVTYNYQRKLFMLEVDRNMLNNAFIPIPVPDVATTAKNGLLSKEDKVKLDKLSSGGSSAITEYTEAEITALLNQINF